MILDSRARERRRHRRRSYDGRDAPGGRRRAAAPEITTRDVDRGDVAHYLLKEMSEAPASFRKTLRGQIVDRDGWPRRSPPARDAVAARSLERLRAGEVAARPRRSGRAPRTSPGRASRTRCGDALRGHPVAVEAVTATELSGFGLDRDMSDTLVVAISQSGTTTDTNRTVDLARARGAVVVAIVNRRQSDLVDKSDGVLYTSDGRDVEMSVASTKAFYAQIAAGFLLAFALAAELGADDDGRSRDRHERARRRCATSPTR